MIQCINHSPSQEASLTNGKAVLIFGHIHTYLGGILTTCPFRKMTVACFPMGLFMSQCVVLALEVWHPYELHSGKKPNTQPEYAWLLS